MRERTHKLTFGKHFCFTLSSKIAKHIIIYCWQQTQRENGEKNKTEKILIFLRHEIEIKICWICSTLNK